MEEGKSFIDEINEDKFKDFLSLSKEDFLFSYSYLTEEDYNKTLEDLQKIISIIRRCK